MSDQPIIGGTEFSSTTSPEEQKRLERRALCQRVFDLPDAEIQQAMVTHHISAAELQDANDYRADAIARLRAIPVEDGFQGLKVYSDAELKVFFAWKATQPNPVVGGTFADAWAGKNPMQDPLIRAQAMEVMDRVYAVNHISPEHKVPWL